MISIRIQYDLNKNVNLIHILNYIMSNKIETLDRLADIHKQFHSEKDIVFEVPEDIACGFKRWLDALGCVYE